MFLKNDTFGLGQWGILAYWYSFGEGYGSANCLGQDVERRYTFFSRHAVMKVLRKC